MTHLTFIRYFVPDSNEFAPGWYQTRNEGRTRIGDVPLSLSDALYDGPNRVIIDDNTPETNTLPVSGGKGVDEFLITRTANSVVIDDDSGANVIVFERDVVITSIERQAGSEGASVAQYVITLSSGKTITLRNPASFTFQHLGDATRTDPISAEDFFIAYEDGFAASDTSHPDIIGDASGPSGVQGPMITGTATGSVTEDDAGNNSATGTLSALGQTIGLDGANNLGRVDGTYGQMRFDAGSGQWTYTLDNNNLETNKLAENATAEDVFTFSAGTSSYTVTITVTGVNDAPVVSGEFFTREGPTGERFTLSNLSDRFTDVDQGDELTFTVTLDDGVALSAVGLTYDSDEDEITGTLTETGAYVIKIVATDKIGATVEATFELNILRAIPIILRNSLTYNPDATSITIDETMLGVTSGNESDPTLLVYTITTLPDAGRLLKSGTPLNNGDTFTQADINNGLITYEPSVSNPHTSQSNPLSFTFSDGVADLEEQTLEITSREVVGNTAYEGDLSTSGDLDVNDDTLPASTTPFTISTQGTYGTASIGDDGEWVYKLDNGHVDVRVLNSGDTLTDTFVVDVNLASGRAKTQTVTITISGRTDVLGTNDSDRRDSSLGDASTSDNQAIFGFNSSDTLTGGSGDDLLVGGYGYDIIDLSAGGIDTVVYRINSSDTDGLVKAEDGLDSVREFTPGEDKLVILDVNGSPTTLAGLFDSLTKDVFELRISGDDDRSGDLSSSELDAGARTALFIDFQASGTVDGGLTSVGAGRLLIINFDRVTSEALTDMTVWDTLTGGTNFSSDTISTVAQLSSLFGGFGRPGYDAALDDGGFISIIGPDDLPDSYFEIISGDETGSVTEGGAPGDDNRGTLTASGTVITLVPKEITDSPGTSTGTYGTMTFDGRSWTYTLAVTPEQGGKTQALNEGQTETETFTFSAGVARFEVTITVTGVNDAPTVSEEFFTRVGAAGGQFILTNLSDQFTDVDQGDELTFTVTLDDGAALSTIGLTYDSDEDEITGTLTETGSYVIKIVATDKSGATGEATFELNILGDIPIILRNSLTYNPDATSITIDETMLKVASGNESDPALLVYTITTLPDAGMLLKSGTPLNNGDTFTQADINNGLITYVPSVSDSSTSQSNPLSFTISDGVATSEEETLEITSREVVGNVTVYEGDPSTSGGLDVNDDTLLASTTPFTISTQGTYGTASIGDDGEWVYKLDNGNADVRALNSGDTLTDAFLVDVNLASGRAKTQIITITISGRTDVFSTNRSLGDASTSDNQAIFGFNYADTLTGGRGDDLLVGGYGADRIDLSAGGTDTVVYRINSSDADGRLKAEDGGDTIIEFTPGEDKLVILDVNGSPTTLADFFDSLTKHRFQLRISRDVDRSGDLSSSELDAGARAFIQIPFRVGGTVDGGPSFYAGRTLRIFFDRVTSEALNDRAVWDTLTGGTNFSEDTVSTVAQLSSLFGGFGRPGYDMALDDGGFISIIGPDDLPDSYFAPISGDETGSVTEGGAPGDDNTGTLTAPGNTITLVSKETTDSPGTSTGTYGVMRFNASSGEWVYTLDDRAEALADQQTETESFTFSAEGGIFVVTITITGVNDAPSGDFFTRVGAAGGQFILTNLSDQFTDVDQGDELTFEVTLDDGAALSTIGLTYDSDEDEITGSVTETGTYVIKIVATDKIGATVEATFELNIFSAIPIIQRNSLTYNPDATSITIDETMLEVTSDNQLDPTLLVYTITTLPDAGMLLKSGAQLNNGDTFTQADINNGLITYVPNVGSPYTSQSNPLSFTISDGVVDLEEQTLEITSREVVGNTVYEGDPSTSGDLDVNDDTLLASTTPFTISTQGTYGTASIGDDGEWVYKLDNGNADVRALNSGDTLTDTFVVDVNLASGRAKTQTATITISGRTDVLGTNGQDRSLGDASTSDNQAIFGFNSRDTLTGGSGDDLLVSGYGADDRIDLSAGGADTVVYRINSSDGGGRVKAEDGGGLVIEFTPGEDKLVILDVNESPTTLASLFDSLTKDAFQLYINSNDDGDRNLSSSELDAGARYFIQILFQVGATVDRGSGRRSLQISFDRVTSEALNDRAVWDTLTGGTNFSTNDISTVAQLSSLFGGFGRPGYDAALDDGSFISIIGPDDLPDSYFEIISGDETGSVTEGGAPGDDNTGTLTAPGNTITLVSKETTDSPGTSTGTYGVMTFNASSGEWVYTLDDRAEALAEQQTETESFTFSVEGGIFVVTITITGANDAPTVSGEFFTRVGAAGGQFILTNLSDRFTDVDEGDELTFTVTLDDGAALSTIGLTYDSDEDEITGTLTRTGSYVIKIVATDKIGATVEATFELNIFSAIPIIQRNSLTYNPDATSITIDETMLEVTSGNESDPAFLVYTITTLPDAGVLSKSGTPLNNGDTFTQADINNGLITYVPNVSSPYTLQSNPLSFTISDGVVSLEEQTLEITSRKVVGNTVYEGEPSTSGDLDVNDDTLLDSTTPFTISTQGTYGTASIGDDGEWVYKLDNGHADVRALNSGDTLTDTFVVDVNLASGRAKTQTATITISGRTDVFGTNGQDYGLGDASTSDNQAIFGFNSRDSLTGGSGDDLLVGGYGVDFIDLSAGGTDTVVYRINSSDGDGLVKAEDGSYDDVMEFTPGEDKLVILDVNGSPTTPAGLFDSLTKDAFRLSISGDDDRSGDLSSSELDAGARAFIDILFQVGGTSDGGSTSAGAGGTLRIIFDRVTSEALNDRAVWDTLTGGTNFSGYTISTVAQLSSLFGGFGRPGYDAALDDGGFISIIGPDDLPDSYFAIISGDETGSVTEGGAPGDDNTGTLTASGNTITLVSKETTDSPGTSTGTYGVMRFNASSGEWVYTLNDRAEALADQQTETESFIFSAGDATFEVTITVTGANDAPVVESGNEIVEQAGRVGQEIKAIDLSGLFTDVDTGDTFTLTVMVLSSDGNTRTALDTLGLEYDSDTKMITGTLLNSVVAGPYTIEVIATDGGGGGVASQPSTFTIVVSGFGDGAPTADPMTSIESMEDYDYEFPSTTQGLMDLFGFADPRGNDPEGSTPTSAFVGVYIKIVNDNGTLMFIAPSGSETEVTAGNASTFDLGDAPAKPGYVYVTLANLEKLKLRPNLDFNGNLDWDYQVWDGEEASEDATLSIAVTPVNDAPRVADGKTIGDVTVDEGEVLRYNLRELFTDPENGRLATFRAQVFSGSLERSLVILEDGNAPEKIRISTGGVGELRVVFTVGDNEGAETMVEFTLTIRPANVAPTVVNAITSKSLMLNKAINAINLSNLFSDPNNDQLTLTVMLEDSSELSTIGLSYDPVAKEIAGTPAQLGIYTIRVTADDGRGGEHTSEFKVVVGDADQEVKAGEAIAAINLGAIFGNLNLEDATVTLAEGGDFAAAGFTFDGSSKMISGAPIESGTYTIVVTVGDLVAKFTIEATARAIDGSNAGTVIEDDTASITGMINISGTQPPTIELSSGASEYGEMTFDEPSGVWTYTLDNRAQALGVSDVKTETFTFTANGPEAFDVTITIQGTNDDPMVSAEFFNSKRQTDEQFTLSNLSDRFTDVDEGDELTFEVTFHDSEDAEVDIGLTYNSDEDEITGTLTGTGTYVIKIVATDKSGATVEATFDLNINIFSAILIIQRNSLTYNPDETSITIDETMLKVTSGNQSDPTLLVYTITTLPDAGVLSKNGTPLNSGDTFTQADINNGLITYVPDVSDPSTSQSNPLSFTISDGVATLEEQTLQITSREVFEDADADADEDNLIDQSSETTPQKIEAGDGSDTITSGQKDDQIDGGAGDDEIILTRTVGDVEVDAGADEVLYTFGYDGVGIDGGDEIVGFKRGQDKLTFVVDRNFNSLTEFLQSLSGADETDLTADDAFIVTMQWGLDTDGAFYFESVLLHFKDASAFGGGRVSSPLVTVTFDERLGLGDLIEILGGAENVANNFDGGLAAFKNLDEVLPRLFGEGSIGFKGVDPSGTNGASERASEEPQPPIYETLSEQHGDDLQPTSFELGGGETDII